MIFSVVFLSQAILEIPTGLLSDFIGRRKTLLVGAFSAFLALFFYALGLNVWILVLGATFEGLGRSLFSGTAKALLYETLQEKKRLKEFEVIFGKTPFDGTTGFGIIRRLRWFFSHYFVVICNVDCRDTTISVHPLCILFYRAKSFLKKSG